MRVRNEKAEEQDVCAASLTSLAAFVPCRSCHKHVVELAEQSAAAPQLGFYQHHRSSRPRTRFSRIKILAHSRLQVVRQMAWAPRATALFHGGTQLELLSGMVGGKIARLARTGYAGKEEPAGRQPPALGPLFSDTVRRGTCPKGADNDETGDTAIIPLGSFASDGCGGCGDAAPAEPHRGQHELVPVGTRWACRRCGAAAGRAGRAARAAAACPSG